MDMAARQLKMDPIELRLKNLVHPGDNDPSGGAPLGDARIIDCLNEGARLFDWYRRVDNVVTEGRYRTGVGFACCTHGNGYYMTPYHDVCAMSMRVNEDGTIVLRSSLHELGNGTLTAVAQIVAEVFQTNVDQITVTEGDTFLTPYDIGCQASRVIHVSGRCAQELSEQVLEKIKGIAATQLGCSVDSVMISKMRRLTQKTGDKNQHR
jgi:Aerobic-type carbon monoxide dehydrogenase, large subunit CoxL/CutL homologs